MATIERTSAVPAEPDNQVNLTGPGPSRLVNGVNICRLVLVAAAIASLVYAFSQSQYYFVLLAVMCVGAIVIKTRNVRTILGAIATVECMYFVADIFSPLGGSLFRNIVMAAVALMVHVAITRLRFWESSEHTDLHRHLYLLAGTAGLVLVISAALMAFAPVTSGQIGSSTTDTQCGSVLLQRSLPSAWENVQLPLIKNQCGQARHERLAFSLLQLEVGIGAMWVGRVALRRQPKRLLAVAGAIALLSGGVGVGWSSAAVFNANSHDQAFAPWVNRYSTQFAAMAGANQALTDSINAGNSNGVIAACSDLRVIDDQLAGSINDWPTDNGDDKAAWQKFVEQHRADAASCIDRASLTTSKKDLQSTEWFSESATTLSKLRSQISYQ